MKTTLTSTTLSKRFEALIDGAIEQVEMGAHARCLHHLSGGAFDAIRRGRKIADLYPQNIIFECYQADGGAVPNSYDYAAAATFVTITYSRQSSEYIATVERTRARTVRYGDAGRSQVKLWAPVGSPPDTLTGGEETRRLRQRLLKRTGIRAASDCLILSA